MHSEKPGSFVRLVLGSLFLVSSTQLAAEKLASEVAVDLKGSLAKIEIFENGVAQSSGSAFVIDSAGVLATSAHVLEGGTEIRVTLPSGETFERILVLGVDSRRDIALIRVPTAGLDSLEIDPADDVKVGDDIYVMGNPMGLDATFSSGVLSGVC